MLKAIQASTGCLRHVHEAKRRARERDAVCNCEGGHGSYKTARAFHQNHQREDKQQMVNPAPNVFDAKAQICASHSQPRL